MNINKINSHQKFEPSLWTRIVKNKISGNHDFHVLTESSPPTGEQLDKLLENGLQIESTFDDIVTGSTNIQSLQNIATLDFVRLIALKSEMHF